VVGEKIFKTDKKFAWADGDKKITIIWLTVFGLRVQNMYYG
jgi:hypothetical protein